MIALQITEIKPFMNQLLLSHTFDQFRVQEAVITTYSTFYLDGHLQKEYYSKEELEHLHLEEETLASWEQLRPFCLQLVKGKHTPLNLKIVFQLSLKNLDKLLLQTAPSYSRKDIGGLYLNIRYDGTSLSCITGTSLHLFTLDKTLEQEWDRMVQRFFASRDIAFTQN